MSPTITIEEAQAKLKELIHQLAPGEQVIITENQQPVAKLVNEHAKADEAPSPRSWPVQGDDHLHGPGLRRPSGGHEGVHGVKLLLDTHTFLWHADGDSRMSPPVTAVLTDPSNGCF